MYDQGLQAAAGAIPRLLFFAFPVTVRGIGKRTCLELEKLHHIWYYISGRRAFNMLAVRGG